MIKDMAEILPRYRHNKPPMLKNKTSAGKMKKMN